MFSKEFKLNRIFKLLLVVLFLILTLIGLLFGVQQGVNYGHIKLAFFAISIPIALTLTAYFLRFGSNKPTLYKYAVSILFVFYTSVVGGGYLYLINAIGTHHPKTVSGLVMSKEQFKGKYKPSFYITFEDSESNVIMEIELSSYKYNDLKVGDTYTEIMYIGSLGLLYRQKT